MQASKLLSLWDHDADVDDNAQVGEVLGAGAHHLLSKSVVCNGAEVRFDFALTPLHLYLFEHPRRAKHVAVGGVVRAHAHVRVRIGPTVSQTPRAERARASMAPHGETTREVDECRVAAGALQREQAVYDVTPSLLHLRMCVCV